MGFWPAIGESPFVGKSDLLLLALLLLALTGRQDAGVLAQGVPTPAVMPSAQARDLEAQVQSLCRASLVQVHLQPAGRDRPASASVTLRTDAPFGQAEAIKVQELLATSVPGLEARNVAVIVLP